MRIASILVLALCIQPFAGYAQTQPGLEQGIKPYGSYDGGDIDSISMVNGSLTLHIPLISYPQRGGRLGMAVYVVHNANILQPSAACNPKTHVCDDGSYDVTRTPLSVEPIFPGFNPGNGTNVPATVGDYDGATHQMLSIGASGYRSIDATGWYFVTAGSGYGTLIDREGNRYNTQTGTWEDVNGNLITTSYNAQSQTTGWTDTMGRDVPAYPLSATSTSDFSGCTGSYATSSAYLWSPPGPNGGTSQFKLCNAGFNISFTAPDCIDNGAHSDCTATGETVTFLQSVVLPNGTAWTFEYNNFGDLSSVTLPTGGTISYTWGYSNFSAGLDVYEEGVNTGLLPYARSITSRTVNDETGNHVWNYSFGNPNGTSTFQTVVTDPALNDAVHTETSLGPGVATSFYETELDQYSGSHTSGTLLKKTVTSYNYSYSSNLPDGDVAFNVVPLTVTTTDELSGKVSQVTKTYDAGVSIGSGYSAIYGDVLTESDYDYGTGAPGNLLRTTTNAYMALTGPNSSSYLANNLLSLPYTVQIKDGGGNQMSLAQYNYDETSRASSGLTSSYQFSSSPPAGTYRGNNTSVYRWLNSGTFTCPNGNSGGSGGYLIGKKTYFDDGMLNTDVDPCGNTTTYAYNLTYWGALPTTVTNALNQATTNTYDFNTSLLASTTDPNNLTTSYSYDSMWRISQVNHPDGGVDTITHQETTFPFTATLTSKINSSQSKSETNVFDGLGRVSEHQLTSDPQSTVYTDTTYDALGRVATVSNPYRSGTDATTSSGITTYGYDALSRKITVSYPGSDNSVLKTAYCGPSTRVTDPTGRWRRSEVDGLGRLIEVDEPNAVGASVNSNGCPNTNDPIWVTAYTLDGLGNVKQIVQNGSHTRTFTYDSLSRLLTSVNPENSSSSTPVSYAYNPDGTVLMKTDARGITTCFASWSGTSCSGNTGYDALHRVLTVTFSNGDPTLTYAYDQTNCLSLSACQNVGHRTSMTDGAGSESWAYQVDSTNLRSIHREQRTNNSSPSNVTKTTTYYLDLAGNVTQLVYPTGRTVNYTYDSADRPASAADSSNGITYVADWKTPPASTNCTAGNVCYTPQGSAYAMSLGQTSSFTGLNISESFNSRLQPNEIKASSSVGNAIDITYNFIDPVSTHNAGVVYGTTNNLNSSRTQTFTYDQLNRILLAGTSATTGTYCWGYQFSYDAWGNLLQQAGWTTYSGCTESTMSVTADGNNHLSGLSYDSAGNTLSDGNYSYTWDGQSQLKTAGGVTYSYDGDGRRTAKAGSKFYWYGSGNDILAETDTAGNTQDEYVFFGGKRVAVLPAGSGALLYSEDTLGSSRVIVQANGTLCYDADFTPFGGEKAYTNSCSQNYKFEGKERDTETQNDNFEAREYTWRFGRWLSSDWSAKPIAVPYANLSNPQTLNLYAMVEDDPESFADLDGHCVDPFSCGTEFAGIGTLIEPGGGTAVGALVGTLVGAGITYFAGKAILNEIHHSNETNNSASSSSSTTTTEGAPARTAKDELPRDANGKPVPDAEASGAAHTQLGTRQSRSKPGTSYPQSREFDKDGNPVKDIDHTDHGRDDHANPHQHPYDPNTGKRLPQAPVRPTPPQSPPSPPSPPVPEPPLK